MKLSNANLRLFAAIADQGSLSAAARYLGVQKSTVSRELASLERQLGHRLLERTSRQARLTEVGHLLLAHAHRVIDEIQEAESAIEAFSAEPSGRLNISLPHAVAQKLVVPLLPAFLQRYPKISIGLDLSIRNVDLVGAGIDLAIRIGDLPASSLVARNLGTLSIILVASPAFLAVAGTPQSAQEIGNMETVALGTSATTVTWDLHSPEGHVQVKIQPRVTASEIGLVRDLVVAGLGIGSLPRAFVTDDLARGTLVRVLPDVTRGAPAIHAVYPSRLSLASKTRVFIEAVMAALSLDRQD
jgi:DNA-binding transcriptional LysR family regulator